MTTSCCLFDFSELRGRIKTVCKTEQEFARKIGRTYQFVSRVFNGKTYFSMIDIKNSCEVLDIPNDRIGFFFYANGVDNSQ